MANNYNNQTLLEMLQTQLNNTLLIPALLNVYYVLYLCNKTNYLYTGNISNNFFYDGNINGNFMLGNLFACKLKNAVDGSPQTPVFSDSMDIATMNVVSAYIIQPFLYRVPYADFNTFTNRMVAILNKYSINIYNYIIKYIQLQNIQKLLNQTASKMLTYQTNTNTSINTTNSANEVGGTSFNPVTGGSVSVTMPKASSDDTINIDGIANAQASNSNYETTQKESQGTSHNLTEQSLTIYKEIRFEMDNCLQPILKAVNSLFYIFDVNDGGYYDY